LEFGSLSDFRISVNRDKINSEEREMASKVQRGNYALHAGDKFRRMFEGWWSAVA
jgi:hypothetical protein